MAGFSSSVTALREANRSLSTQSRLTYTSQTRVSLSRTRISWTDMKSDVTHRADRQALKTLPKKINVGAIGHWYKLSYFCKPPQLCLHVFYIDLSPYCPSPFCYTALWGRSIGLSGQFKQNWKLKYFIFWKNEITTWAHSSRSQSCFKPAMSLWQSLSCLVSGLLTSNSLQDSWRSAFSSSKHSISLWH